MVNSTKSVMARKYRYTVYGLNVESDFKLKGLIETHEEPDVIVMKGEIPCQLLRITSEDSWFKANHHEFILLIDRVANYYISDGNTIVIEEADDADDSEVRLYLLGTVFGVLLLQRGLFAIHGSAPVIEDQCIIITGDSGVGKSSLCQAFRRRGYKFLTDDVAATVIDENDRVIVKSSYPLQKLWKDSAKNAGLEVESYEHLSYEETKYYVPSVEDFETVEKPAVAIFELFYDEYTEHVRIERLHGSKKMEAILRNVYRVEFVNDLGLSVEHFKYSGTLCNRLEVYKIVRPKLGFTVEQQIDLILQVLNNC